jgi:ABC-type phosphate transport system substrate-binding protein
MVNSKSLEIFRNYLALPLFLAMVATNAHAEVVVIVSAKSDVTSLTAEQTARIFLGKTTRFPNGDPAFPIDQVESRSVKAEFYSKVAHKNATQLSAYWAKVIFTGQGRPPIELEGNLTIRNVVEKNKNAIGYIEKRYVNRSVRVVLEP